MWHVLALGTGMAFGLYAGKKRAKGETWRQVAVDLSKDVWRNAVAAYDKVAEPFRRGKPESDEQASKGSETITPEVV